MQTTSRQIAINNYHQIVKDYSLNRRQQMVLEYFWMFSKQKFIVDEVVEKFQQRYGSGINKDNIAPRITELHQKGLLTLVGERKNKFVDPFTNKERTITKGEYQLTDLSEQPSLF